MDLVVIFCSSLSASLRCYLYVVSQVMRSSALLLSEFFSYFPKEFFLFCFFFRLIFYPLACNDALALYRK